jgi:cytoskeleton protein RodZ
MSEGIGARLRSARERSRLTILQAAERLHVDADILEALEAENFAVLGAQVYVKGHLRHYAELVGESPEALFELYSQGKRVPQPDLTRVPKPQRDDAGRLVVPAVIGLIGFAVAGAVWWVLSLAHRPWSTTAARPVSITTAAAPMPVPAASASPAGTVPAANAARAVGPVPAADAAVAPAGHVDLVLTYSQDSWTEVYDATGRRLLYGLATAPATHKLEGVPPLSVMLGDASGVTIEVGDRAASISRFVRADHTARFLVAADGRVLAAPRKKRG